MARKKCKRYSGIGGQAVLEGIMMRNQDKYAVAVRRTDGEIDVEVETHKELLAGSVLKKLPFIRGIFQFIDSLTLGMRSLNHSTAFYEEEDAQETKFDKALDKLSGGNGEKLMTTIVTVISLVLAIGIFIVLPYYVASLFDGFVRNRSLMAIIEGVLRITIFVFYVWAISWMKDIRRLYQYHGAEHKCINCIEKGRPLTVRNAMRSSRLHKRCGTSFMFFVLFVSIVLFFFIRVENPFYRVLIRVALMPVVAGISYEIIRLAGRTDNILVRMLSAPGMMIQRMTTKEPDETMVEVGIAAVEAVFDWRAYLQEHFGYKPEELTEEALLLEEAMMRGEVVDEEDDQPVVTAENAIAAQDTSHADTQSVDDAEAEGQA
ncbi:MAG: DUF1385 domain-containing protein [Lachnospiraceae bacterium]|nr:DUF1385 domain-containing protein [Lachnospiraceae bacterium]